MRGFVTVVLLLLAAPPATAGLYNTSEPDVEKKSDPGVDPRDWFILVFRDTLAQLRSIGLREVPIDKPLRKRCLAQVLMVIEQSREYCLH